MFRSPSRKPKINKMSHRLPRNGGMCTLLTSLDVSSILYKDALRRQESSKHRRMKMMPSLEPKMVKSTTDRINNNYMVSKLAKELEKV